MTNSKENIHTVPPVASLPSVVSPLNFWFLERLADFFVDSGAYIAIEYSEMNCYWDNKMSKHLCQ